MLWHIKELVRELAKEQLEKFKQSGVEITELKDIDLDSFKTAVEPLYQGYEQEYGADLINKFR